MSTSLRRQPVVGALKGARSTLLDLVLSALVAILDPRKNPANRHLATEEPEQDRAPSISQPHMLRLHDVGSIIDLCEPMAIRQLSLPHEVIPLSRSALMQFVGSEQFFQTLAGVTYDQRLAGLILFSLSRPSIVGATEFKIHQLVIDPRLPTHLLDKVRGELGRYAEEAECRH